MSSTVLVTGATGTVGQHVARGLSDRSVPAVAATRRPAAPNELPLSTRRFDFEDPATYDAFEGIEQVFLVRPPALARVWEHIFPTIEAAARVGVQHVVFLSLLGAEQNPLVPHRWIEWKLRRSGMTATLLRPSFFMQNLATTHRAEIRDENRIFVPAGQGATSFIDARDIAAVATEVLTTPELRGDAFALTGAEALTYHEVAQRFSEVLGRTITYDNPSMLTFARRMRRRGHPWPFVGVMTGIYLTARLSLAARTTDDVERVLGRPPTPMRSFVRDYRDCWTPEDAQSPEPPR